MRVQGRGSLQLEKSARSAVTRDGRVGVPSHGRESRECARGAQSPQPARSTGDSVFSMQLG